jgi:hypothetical protein
MYFNGIAIPSNTKKEMASNTLITLKDLIAFFIQKLIFCKDTLPSVGHSIIYDFFSNLSF